MKTLFKGRSLPPVKDSLAWELLGPTDYYKNYDTSGQNGIFA